MGNSSLKVGDRGLHFKGAPNAIRSWRPYYPSYVSACPGVRSMPGAWRSRCCPLVLDGSVMVMGLGRIRRCTWPTIPLAWQPPPTVAEHQRFDGATACAAPAPTLLARMYSPPLVCSCLRWAGRVRATGQRLATPDGNVLRQKNRSLIWTADLANSGRPTWANLGAQPGPQMTSKTYN